MCIFIERDNLKKVIQFYYIGLLITSSVGLIHGELNQPNWLLNHEKLPCILQVIIFSKIER